MKKTILVLLALAILAQAGSAEIIIVNDTKEQIYALEKVSVTGDLSANKLMLKGKCDFVPDGEIVRLTDYRIDSIDNMKVVEFEMDNLTVWTFNVLVQSTDFSNL